MFFHEGIHYVQRKLKKDAAYLTPLSKDPSTLNFEAGYCLDHIVWGDYKVKYWIEPIASLAFNEDRWKHQGSVFTEQEIKTAQIEEVESHCGGLFASDPACIDM